MEASQGVYVRASFKWGSQDIRNMHIRADINDSPCSKAAVHVEAYTGMSSSIADL